MPLPSFQIALLTDASTGAIDSGTSYDFADMIGDPFRTVSQRGEVIKRAGVDDHALRKLGKDAEPFTIVTVGYHADLATCDTALAAYKLLEYASPGVRVTKNDRFRYPVDVLEVQFDQDPRWVGKVVSARYPTPVYAELRTRWRLIARSVPAS